MSQTQDTPYATLDPDLILNAVESIGLHCSGGLLALNSFENRVYQIGIEDANPIIAKFYRPGRWSDDAIREEHQFAFELNEHEIPVVAPLIINDNSLHFYQGFRFALFERKGGRALELDNLDQLEWMGRFIGRLHAVGACKPFQHRTQLTVQTYGYECYQFLSEQDFIPAHLKEAYDRTVDAVLKKVERCFQQAGRVASIRLHGDCHPGNVLWRDSGPHIVDLDDCLMGPAVQDIWMLLPGEDESTSVHLDRILRGYREFYDFNPREICLVEALRSLRMIMYSAWLARRWEDPAFPLNFPWFNTGHYWQGQLHDLNEQARLLDDAYDLYY